MIQGLGTDLVHAPRLVSWIDNGMAERFFHPAELDYARSRGRETVDALAARFAAKEAFGKALGTGLGPLVLRDMEVYHDGSGRPCLRVHGRVREEWARRGSPRIWLSLAHDRDFAVATVILEGDG